MGRTTTTVRHRRLKRHRIIERPRLFALLDESKAHVRTLVAPAGYGKTTLAEQWIRRDGRESGWFTARRSSTDVAALALGLASASTHVLPGCDVRLREHLRIAPAPAQHVEVVAELLAEDLASWPTDAWLVLDDYHEVAAGRDAERFVAELVAAAPVQFLIAGRQRPSWVTARSILYGDVLELNQTALAMDTAEATEVLAGRGEQSAPGLVALANGWPAVIGLASVSSAEIDAESEPVPESLYHFFADEVFASLDEDVRRALAVLAVPPVLDRVLVAEILGPDLSERVAATALDVGLVVERGAHLDLHPLARSFLEERGAELGLDVDEAVAQRCLLHYRERRDWDAAFDLITRSGPVEPLEELLVAALDELLDTARLSTLETWCDFAASSGVDSPAFQLARAEVALRHGRHAEAQAYAESAASSAPLAFRSYSVAGRSAHLASREHDGLELYRRAESLAATEGERRDARWGQLRCLIELELPGALEMLGELSPGARFADPREKVQAAAHTLHCQLKFTELSIAEADVAFQLLKFVGDPLVRSSFLSVYSVVLGLAARYDEAGNVARQLLSTAQDHKLDFARPYGLCSLAISEAGQRDWERAEAHLVEALDTAREGWNRHAEQLCQAARLRGLAQQGKFDEALGLEIHVEPDSIPAVRAELVASRALVLAAVGRLEDAARSLDTVRGTTQALEPRVLSAAVDAVVRLRRRDPNAVDSVVTLEDVAFETGAVDLLITAYRSVPELLAVLIRPSARTERIEALIRRVHDDDLARLVGLPVGIAEDRTARLTPREREVYGLLCQGLSNRQIGKALFISEATAKLHAQRVYDKTGIRSRTALAVQAALARANQATSAIDKSESSSDE